MTLARSIATVGGLTMVSRVLGFARDILVANFLGAGMVADAFFVAFRFPNLFRRLFAEGAFSAAFVPVYAGLLETEGPGKARQFADQAFSVLALVLVAFVALIEIAMPWAMYGLAPGFDATPGKMELATELARIAFPYLFFISLVSLQSGVLNALGRFAAAAAAPALLNVTLITAILGLTPLMETAGHALAWGVAAAGVVQFVWLAVHCRRAGVAISLVWPRLSHKVRLLGRRILPVVFGSSLYQINLLIGTILASLISDGAVSFLYYADRIVQLPLGVVGVAVGTALLPTLSRQIKGGHARAAEHSMNRGLEFALLLTLPAAVALVVIPGPVVSVLFQRGAFAAADGAATAAALTAFATGLPAYVLIKVLAPGFFAREDTATPVRVAAWAMAANIVFNVILMQFYGHVGIAIGASLSAWLNAGWLACLLHRRGFLTIDARLRARVPRTLLASMVMGAAVALGGWAFADALAGDFQSRAVVLAALVALGLAVFAAAAALTGAAGIDDVKRFLGRDPA